MSPSQVRLAAIGPGGFVEPSGVAKLKTALSSDGVASVYDTWRNQRLTKLVAGALRDMILNQPVAGQSSDSMLVQYGVTQGLEMAYQLLVDPSIIIPGAFDELSRQSADVIPEETYDTPSDGVSNQ